MTIYETENKEIIDLYNLYIEVKDFITSFENKKQLFKTHYNIKQKSIHNYAILPNQKSNYNNFYKVYKMFMEGIDKVEYQKYLNISQIMSNIYYYSNYDKSVCLWDNTRERSKCRTIEEIQNLSATGLFKCDDVIHLRNTLKAILKLMLNNMEVPLYV